jgi:hypothetical protein
VKKILVALLALSLAASARADVLLEARGVARMITCPSPAGCGNPVGASGLAATINGNAWRTVVLLNMASVGGGAGSAPCNTPGQLWLATEPGGGFLFDDEQATVYMYGTSTCPDSVYVTGSEATVPYQCSFTNKQTGTDGAIYYDWRMFRPCCPVSQGSSNQPSNGESSPFKKGIVR